MTKHVCSVVLVLAAVLMAAAPAGAADLNFTFENPPYTVGSVAGQDGWYQEETASVPVVSTSAALAGSQSLLFIADSGAPADQRIWRGTGAQTFTDVTTVEFLIQTAEGQLGILLADSAGSGYYRCTVDSEFENWTIGYGADAATLAVYAGGSQAFKPNKLHRVTVTLDFANLTHRTVATNLTDSVAVIDTGILAMDATTTKANAATDNLYTGMRFIGGHNWTSHSEGRIDSIQFNPPPPPPPGSSNFTFENPPYTVGSVAGQDGWYQEETASVPVVSTSAALAGSQSLLFIADSGAPADQRIWRGTGAQTFTDVTTVEFLIQTAEGQLGILLADSAGSGYYRCTVDSEFENWTIGYGADAATLAVYAGGSQAFKPNKLHRVTVTLDFANLTHRTVATNLTDSVAVIDTGILAMDATTTKANAATDNLYTGMRFIGGHNWTSHSEGRVDNIRFLPVVPVAVPLPGSLLLVGAGLAGLLGLDLKRKR